MTASLATSWRWITDLFWLSLAHENDAERAVGAALDIVAAVARLETTARQQLTARIGVSTGLVVVGDLWATERRKVKLRSATRRTLLLACKLWPIPGQSRSPPARAGSRPGTSNTAISGGSAQGLGGTGRGLAGAGPSAVESRFEAEHGINLAAAARPPRGNRTTFASLAESGARRRLRGVADRRARHRQVTHRFDV